MVETAQDIMTVAVVTTTPSATVADVAEALAKHHVSGMPVVSGDEDKVVGIITDADVLTAAEGATVDSVMTRQTISVQPDTPIGQIIQILTDGGIRRVPVIDWTGVLVGIVSRADIITAMAAEQTTYYPP